MDWNELHRKSGGLNCLFPDDLDDEPMLSLPEDIVISYCDGPQWFLWLRRVRDDLEIYAAPLKDPEDLAAQHSSVAIHGALARALKASQIRG
jgi:hypothetical protein